MAINVNPLLVYDLRRELSLIRKESLLATRAGDYMKVAKLTRRAAQINRRLLEAENQAYALRLP